MLLNLQRILEEIPLNATNTNPTNLNLEDKKCELFGAFSFIVQFILGVLSFMVLFIKRFLETPRRPWKVWFFDVSKQFFSASAIHLMNLFIAIFLASNNDLNKKSDECMWYFINLSVDTTIGVLICFALLLLINKLAKDHNIKDLQSGMYYENFVKNGKPGIRLKPKMYFTQLAIWSKLFLLAFTKLFSYYLEIIGDFVLKPFTVNDKLELFMVMIVFPLVFNAIQFWIIDNILKLPPEEIKEINENENREEEIFGDKELNSINKDNNKIKQDNELKEIIQKNEYVPPLDIEIIKEDLDKSEYVRKNNEESVSSEFNKENDNIKINNVVKKSENDSTLN